MIVKWVLVDRGEYELTDDQYYELVTTELSNAKKKVKGGR